MAKKKARRKRPYRGISGPADPQARRTLGLDKEEVVEAGHRHIHGFGEQRVQILDLSQVIGPEHIDQRGVLCVPIRKRINEVPERHRCVLSHGVVHDQAKHILGLSEFGDKAGDHDALVVEDVGPLKIAASIDVEQ